MLLGLLLLLLLNILLVLHDAVPVLHRWSGGERRVRIRRSGMLHVVSVHANLFFVVGGTCGISHPVATIGTSSAIRNSGATPSLPSTRSDYGSATTPCKGKVRLTDLMRMLGIVGRSYLLCPVICFE